MINKMFVSVQKTVHLGIIPEKEHFFTGEFVDLQPF